MAVNTDLVKENQINTFDDLLDPRWRGKITMMDPTAGGAAMLFTGFLLETKGRGYLEALAKQQPVFTRDDRIQIEWITKRKYAMALVPDGTTVDSFLGAGAALKYNPLDIHQLTAGGGSVGVFNGRPHPDAATIFVNWLSSREGQLVFSKAKGAQSRRLDVPVDHLNPAVVRRSGVTYFDQNRREFMLAGEEHKKIAGEIFGPVLER